MKFINSLFVLAGCLTLSACFNQAVEDRVVNVECLEYDLFIKIIDGEATYAEGGKVVFSGAPVSLENKQFEATKELGDVHFTMQIPDTNGKAGVTFIDKKLGSGKESVDVVSCSVNNGV